MNFDQFFAKWIGKSIDADGIYKFQCVDLIVQYVRECYSISGAYGNAIDFWTNPDPKLLAKFTRIAGNNALKGDIVIFYGNAGNPYGHIGIATGNNTGDSIEVLEQNGQTGNGSGQGGDAIRTRYITKGRLAGLLRPTEVVQPSAPLPIVRPYQVEMITPKRLRITVNTNLWGLNYDNLKAIVDNPVQAVNMGNTDFTAVALIRHNIGYNYYATDLNAGHGFNIVDCEDYKPAPLPTGAISADSPRYTTIIKAIPGYMSATNAANHTNNVTIVQPGSNYFLFTSKYGMDNVTQITGAPGAWINPADNVEDVPEPVVEVKPLVLRPVIDAPSWEPPRTLDWRTSYAPFKDGESRVSKKYVALRTVRLEDLEERKANITWKEDQFAYIAGTVEKDGITYLRPKVFTERAMYLCAPLLDKAGSPNFIEYDEWLELIEREKQEYDLAQRQAEAIEANEPLSFGKYVVLFIESGLHFARNLFNKKEKN